MSKKTLPQDLDLESLLSKAIEVSGQSQEEEHIVHDNILEFISFYNIKPGKHPVKRRVLYKMFRAWSKAADYGPNYFGLKLTQFFESDQYNVFISYEAIDLTKKAKEVFFKSDNSSRVKSKHYKQQIEKFMEDLSVTSGDYAVQGTSLYYIYEGWALETRKKVLGIKDFCSMLKFYLPHYKEYIMHPYFFYIDKHNLKVDGVTLEKAKDWSKKQNKRYSKLKTRREEIDKARKEDQEKGSNKES